MQHSSLQSVGKMMMVDSLLDMFWLQQLRPLWWKRGNQWLWFEFALGGRYGRVWYPTYPLARIGLAFFRSVWLPDRGRVLARTTSQSILGPGPGWTPGSDVSSEPPPFPHKGRTRRPRKATAGDGGSSRGTVKSRRHEFGHRAWIFATVYRGGSLTGNKRSAKVHFRYQWGLMVGYILS
jgi:hypothetical protein